jgi:hypothetical protein
MKGLSVCAWLTAEALWGHRVENFTPSHKSLNNAHHKLDISPASVHFFL